MDIVLITILSQVRSLLVLPPRANVLDDGGEDLCHVAGQQRAAVPVADDHVSAARGGDHALHAAAPRVVEAGRQLVVVLAARHHGHLGPGLGQARGRSRHLRRPGRWGSHPGPGGPGRHHGSPYGGFSPDCS